MNDTDISDLPCGCRLIKTLRRCSYHEGYEDGYDACRKAQGLTYDPVIDRKGVKDGEEEYRL